MGSIRADVGDDGRAVISVDHEQGEAAEVQVYLHGDELNVVVSPAKNCATVVTVDDVDIYP